LPNTANAKQQPEEIECLSTAKKVRAKHIPALR